jgi:pimeloyl-ACP methyl ester carboxylesterase
VDFARRSLTVLGVGLLSLCCACEIFCQKTLKVRRRFPTVPIVSLPGEDPAWRTVTIPARDHARLEASFVTPTQHSTKCVLMMHGIGANRDSMQGFVPLFTSQGYRVLLPDGRANGNSGGELITYGLLEKYDTIDWAHWLRTEGCQSIFGLGESLGAAILIQSSAVDPVFKSIVAECSYADLRGVGEYRVQRMAPLPPWLARPASEAMLEFAFLYARPRFGVDLSKVSPVTDIARTKTPILLIHGLADTRTPPWNSEELAKANPRAALWLVPGAGHVGASRARPEEFNRRVLDWFATP